MVAVNQTIHFQVYLTCHCHGNSTHLQEMAFLGYENAENEHKETLNKKVQNWRFLYNFRIGSFVLFIMGLFAYCYSTIWLYVLVNIMETRLAPMEKSCIVIQYTSYLRVV